MDHRNQFRQRESARPDSSPVSGRTTRSTLRSIRRRKSRPSPAAGAQGTVDVIVNNGAASSDTPADDFTYSSLYAFPRRRPRRGRRFGIWSAFTAPGRRPRTTSWLHTTASGDWQRPGDVHLRRQHRRDPHGTLTIAGETLTVTQAGSTTWRRNPVIDPRVLGTEKSRGRGGRRCGQRLHRRYQRQRDQGVDAATQTVTTLVPQGLRTVRRGRRLRGQRLHRRQ